MFVVPDLIIEAVLGWLGITEGLRNEREGVDLPALESLDTGLQTRALHRVE